MGRLLIEDKFWREDRAYVRVSKDMKRIEIVIPGFGPIYARKIGTKQDPVAIERQVKAYARNFYRFHWVR